MLVRLSLLVFLLTFTGCTSSSFLGDPVQPRQDVLKDAPPELVAFNEQFERGRFVLYLADSLRVGDADRSLVRQVGSVERVIIGPEMTEYRFSSSNIPHYVRTATVLRITTHRGSGAKKGARFGLVPGLILIGAGVIKAATREPCAEDSSFCIPPGAFLIAGGGAAAMVGAGLGALVGYHARPPKEITLYEAPLDRYLNPRPPSP